MKRFPAMALLVVLSSLNYVVAQEDSGKPTPRSEKRGSRESAARPEEFPKGYEVFENSISPNKKFGVIFPNPRKGFEDEENGRNFLVALKPSRVLAPNEGHVYFGPHSSKQMQVTWSNNSSAVIVIVAGKWGAIGSTLFVLKDNKVSQRTDLMAEINKALKTKFPKGIRPYNDKLLIAPEGDEEWEFSEDGKEVRIAVEGNTAPNLAPGERWSATFKGTWSVPAGKWTQKEITSRTYTQ